MHVYYTYENWDEEVAELEASSHAYEEATSPSSGVNLRQATYSSTDTEHPVGLSVRRAFCDFIRTYRLYFAATLAVVILITVHVVLMLYIDAQFYKHKEISLLLAGDCLRTERVASGHLDHPAKSGRRERLDPQEKMGHLGQWALAGRLGHPGRSGQWLLPEKLADLGRSVQRALPGKLGLSV
ncbi:Hypp8310 [Branchiostoma lanceolatum]|uniref:Hypp8310 protein n=1 Tax=Branchiostoma lanceolatum TaxID=7740 RepID=A0A8K0EF67_BRALA|nr:Hypp8310 [Branchiostoma lanceolatum]